MIWILFTKLTYRVRNRWSKEEWRIHWNLDTDFENEIRELRGYWQLYELDSKRTLAVYGSDVDIGRADDSEEHSESTHPKDRAPDGSSLSALGRLGWKVRTMTDLDLANQTDAVHPEADPGRRL